MTSKPTVWFVDDLDENLEAFRAKHADRFDVRTFSTPQEVLERLQEEAPDALLCDIFFYDTPEQAAAIERKMEDEAERMRSVAREIGAVDEKYQAGIDLIGRVVQKYEGDPPFPVYAYTSKGPYILDGPSLDRLAACGATVLFKKRISAAGEEMIILNDIAQCKRRSSVLLGLSMRNAVILAAIVGAAAWVVGKLLDYLWGMLFSN